MGGINQGKDRVAGYTISQASGYATGEDEGRVTRRKHGFIAVTAALVFGGGVILSLVSVAQHTAAERMASRVRRDMSKLPDPQEMRRRRLDALTEELHLTQEQRQRIGTLQEALVQQLETNLKDHKTGEAPTSIGPGGHRGFQTMNTLAQSMVSTQPGANTLRPVMDRTEAAIEAVLTPEQRERYREVRETRRGIIPVIGKKPFTGLASAAKAVPIRAVPLDEASQPSSAINTATPGIFSTAATPNRVVPSDRSRYASDRVGVVEIEKPVESDDQ